MAKKYVGAKTLEAFMQIMKTALGQKIDVTAVVDALDSSATDAPLSANQGKVLKEMINGLTGGGDGTESSAAVLYKDLVSTLEGYNAETDAGKAVALALVKALQDQIDSMVAKDSEGNPVTDGTAANADKLDGKDSTDFVQRTDVIDDWANYDADATAAQVVAAALIKAIVDQVDAMIPKDSEGNPITGEDGQPLTGVVAKALDSEKLGGQGPSYYAKAADVTALEGKIGTADGIAPLGSDGKVPAENLPSYVDDVVEGFMVQTTTGEGEAAVTTVAFYEDAEHTTAITGEKSKIYVDVTEGVTSTSWRWSGSAFVEVSGSQDMVEMTEADVQTIWDQIVAGDTNA